jgi:hypothetical protein
MAGKSVKLQAGLRIGRSRGEFKIPDPRISSLHAQVIKHSKGILVLLDQQSSNKIIFNGEKVEKLALLPGIQFVLGDTKLRVVHRPQEVAEASTHPVSNLHISSDQAATAFLPELKEFLSQDQQHLLTPKVAFFEIPLWIEFVQGPEFGRKVALVYGPREFGRESLDIRIEEPSAPPVAFTLSPSPKSPQSIVFDTLYPSLVRLNNQAIPHQEINKTGCIQIGKTKINIYFSEER